MTTPDIDRLESAGFEAWPALRTERVGGWLVRLADGYTKRANSANWLQPDSLDVDSTIDLCAAIFDAEGLRPTFRLVERPETISMDRALAGRGWQSLDPSLVMFGDIDRAFPQMRSDPHWSLLPLRQWATVHARLAGHDAITAERHLRLLSHIRKPTYPAILTIEGEIVACGLAVADCALLGFFDIVTASEHRGRGYARRLMAGQVTAAHTTGVRALYLQVVAGNEPAIGLYRKLGFTEIYRYRYRAR